MAPPFQQELNFRPATLADWRVKGHRPHSEGTCAHRLGDVEAWEQAKAHGARLTCTPEPGGRREMQEAPARCRGFRFSGPLGSDTQATPSICPEKRWAPRDLESSGRFPAYLGLTNETLGHLLSAVEQDLEYGVSRGRLPRAHSAAVCTEAMKGVIATPSARCSARLRRRRNCEIGRPNLSSISRAAR